MQIHELNNFTGALGAGAYLAVDDGNDTGKLSTQQLLAATEARIDNIIAGPAPSAEEIVDARYGADGVTYPSLGDAIRDQVTDLKSTLTAFYVESNNLYDVVNTSVDVQINGVVGEKVVLYGNTNRVVTPPIPCKKGDVFYVTRIDSNNGFGAIASGNFVCAVALDANGYILKREEWVQGFNANVDNVVAVRFTIAKSVYTNNKIINITKNWYPTSAKGVSPYFKYKSVMNGDVNNMVIDMWGDSRFGNGWENYTDVSSYLRNLLNSGISSVPTYGIQYHAPFYIVNNYGIHAQASGMIAARFGSNEVYVNLYGDEIPASGEVTIPVIRCTTGNDANLNCWSTNINNSIPCEINGVEGYLIRYLTTIKFVRKEAGAVATPVRPNTKVDIHDKGSKNHVCMFWAGKNDMGLADGFQVNGVIGNVVGMVNTLKHDRFIVLGETYDCNTETYGAGTTLRNYVDQINAWYKGTYPNNYIDIQQELIDNGLTLEGITPTTADTQNIANGFIPDSLMQDATHMNASGREAIAKIIHSWMQTKGWV